MSETIYDKLIFSDLHRPTDQGIRPNEYDALIKFISYCRNHNIRFKESILDGDVFENWFDNLQDAIKKNPKVVSDLLQAVKSITLGNCYYLPGNHCSKILSYKVPKFLRLILQAEGFITQEKYENSKMVIAHGHQGQYSKAFWIFGSTINIMLYKMAKIFPSLYKWGNRFYEKYLDFDKKTSEDPKVQEKFYRNARKRLKVGNRIMIIGHTHAPYISTNPPNVNTGDWVSSKTFVAITETGKIQVFKFNDKGAGSFKPMFPEAVYCSL